MQNEKKYFLSTDSMLDADSADFVVPQNAWVNMENARTGTTDAGVIGTVESIGSTEHIIVNPTVPCYNYTLTYVSGGSVTFLYTKCNGVEDYVTFSNGSLVICAQLGTVQLFDGNGTYQQGEECTDDSYIAIGTADDVENKRFVTFYYDNSGENNHKIECCYTDTNTIYLVLQNSEVINGLNFTKEPIHSAKISNNILSWVDGTNNEPRKINIESAMGAVHQTLLSYPTFITTGHIYTFPLNFSEITLIKRPPIYPPCILKKYDSIYSNNFISNESFEFAFQYVYYDNETSVVGAYSVASRLNYESDNTNYINVAMDLSEKIPNTVKIVNLIIRISDGKQTGGITAFIAETWDREITSELGKITTHNSGEIPLSYDFYNNITGEYIAQDDVLRPFDNVPIYSRTHEVAKNRYFLGNNIEGYDTPMATSLSLSLNTNNPLDNSPYHPPGYYSFGSRYKLYYIEIKSLTRTYTAPYIVGTFKVNGLINYGYYELKNSVRVALSDGTVVVAPHPWDNSSLFNISEVDIKYRGNTQSSVKMNVFDEYFKTYGNYDDIISWDIKTSGTTFVYLQYKDAFNLYAQKSAYNAGIVFYDYAMRKCGIARMQKSGLKYRTILNVKSIGNGILQFSSIIPYTGSLTELFDVGDEIIINNTSIDGAYIIESITDDTTIVINDISLSATNYESSRIDVYRKINQGNGIGTPLMKYYFDNAINAMEWNLLQVDDPNNPNTVDEEIPEWAYYYSVCRTLNLSKRNYVQGFSNNLKYVTKDSNGAFTNYSNIYNSSTTAGLAIDISSLNNSSLGYVYTDGDQAILSFNGESQTIYELPIIAQDGNYVIVKPIDIGSISQAVNYNLIFEFYTPYQASEQEPYYEMGEVFPILNPGTQDRKYSSLLGIFQPDSYYLKRNFGTIEYNTLAMSPNDTYYQRWDSDAGKINFVTKLGKTENKTQILWSDTIVSGTQINGTSTFRAGNNTYVPTDSGAISKLILTSKVQEQGTVMLSICTNETNSMYLGETQITDSTGKVQFFGANASQVISTINTLKGSFGTVNPEAVTEFRGSVFYPDANRGVWVQYSSNGLFPISNYKMTRFWKLFFKRYLSAEGQQYMADNDIRPYLFSTVDASHLELLISIPQIYETPPKGYLIDYPNEVYPFDIYDGKGKSIVFCLENTGVQPHWQGSYSFNPEQFMCLQNKLYSMKNGNLYQHNMTYSFNNFYGTQYTSKIMVVSNQLPQRPKVYNNVSVEGNMKPIFVYFYNDYPYTQISDLESVDFRDLEGTYYATLYRNKYIDNGNKIELTGLLTGEKMRNIAMKIMFEFDVSDTPLELRFINIGYDISKGHTT